MKIFLIVTTDGYTYDNDGNKTGYPQVLETCRTSDKATGKQVLDHFIKREKPDDSWYSVNSLRVYEVTTEIIIF